MAAKKEDIANMTLGNISKDDIGRLIGDHPTPIQMEIVERLTELYVTEGKGALTANELTIANDIFRLLLKRAVVLVRAMLAMSLSQAAKLPPELARQMAGDVDEVAGPVLQYSEVLNNDALLDIIQSFVDTEKLQAIARRDTVSENVSDALVNTSINPVVSTLVKNEGANIAERTFDTIIKHHSENSEVIESIFQRNSVSVDVLEKVIQRLPDATRKTLEQKYGNLTEMKEVKKALDQNLEMVTLKMLGFKSSDEEFLRVIKELDKNGNFLPLSALVMGSWELFEVSLSRLLRIPLSNVRILLEDSIGFKTMYEKVKLPKILFEAVKLAVRAIREVEYEAMQKTGKRILCTPSQMMERMRLLSAGQEIEGVSHFYEMMQYCAF